jgi:hypothetical protein
MPTFFDDFCPVPDLSDVTTNEHSTKTSSWRTSMPPHNTDDVRIRELKELTPPAHLIREFACAEPVSNLIYNSHARSTTPKRPWNTQAGSSSSASALPVNWKL